MQLEEGYKTDRGSGSGTTAAFSGPAVLFEGSKEVTKITFSLPRALPEDCMWGALS